MLCRLYFTFRDSVYALPKRTVHVFITMISIVYPIVFCIVTYLNLQARAGDESALENAQVSAGIATVISVMFLLTGVWYLTSKFVRNLLRLVQSQNQNVRVQSDSESPGSTTTPKDSEQVIRLNTMQMALLKTATKHTTLGLTTAV